MKGATGFFLCVVNLRYLHSGDVWDGWEICLFLRNWRKGGLGGVKREQQDGSTPRAFCRQSRGTEDPEIYSTPCAPRVPGIPLRRPMSWTFLYSSPNPQAVKKGVQGDLDFPSSLLQVTSPPPSCLFFYPFERCVLECKVHVLFPTNAVLSCF